VIKNIAYFPLQAALNSGPILNAVLDTLQANGIQTQENSLESDAAVIWSVLWHGRMKNNQAVFDHYRSQNKPVIIIEIGALYRGRTWKIAVNHITRDGYYGHLENLDMDRPRKLCVSLATQVKSKPNIIIAMQHSKSQQVVAIPNMTQWLLDSIGNLRKYTDRPITVRPHPRNPVAMPPLPRDVILEQPRKVTNSYDTFDMHFDCHAVVNYNSGPGTQAAIAGVRPVVDSTSLAHAVGVDYADIEKPYVLDRDLWLAQICHTEYTLNEIQTGVWLKRIKPLLTA
jgi:hypothetical protein